MPAVENSFLTSVISSFRLVFLPVAAVILDAFKPFIHHFTFTNDRTIDNWTMAFLVVIFMTFDRVRTLVNRRHEPRNSLPVIPRDIPFVIALILSVIVVWLI